MSRTAMLVARASVRSSVASEKEMLLERFATLCAMLGASMEITGNYPAWEYKRDSALRDTMVRVFTEQYGHAPEDRGHPCRTRVRPVFRQAAGAGLRVLRPGSARDPHAARENVHPLGAAHVEAAARCAGGTCVMFRNIQAWNFAVHCKNHAEPPENRAAPVFSSFRPGTFINDSHICGETFV